MDTEWNYDANDDVYLFSARKLLEIGYTRATPEETVRRAFEEFKRCTGVAPNVMATHLTEDNPVIRLFAWTPETVPSQLKRSIHYADGDERFPLLTEAYLYCLLGKEDARTFLALLRDVLIRLGYDLDTVTSAADDVASGARRSPRQQGR